MTRNMPLAYCILRENNATRRESADVTIARLKFDLTGQPEHKQSLWRIVPINFSHTRRDVADVVPRSRKVFRKAQRRIVLKKLSWLQRYIDVFHVSFAVAIGKNSKTCDALIGSPSTRDCCHVQLLSDCQQLLKAHNKWRDSSLHVPTN
jgi:hypothetical protein